jgi:hypothetical protein
MVVSATTRGFNPDYLRDACWFINIYKTIIKYEGFPKQGYPIAGLFIMENPINIYDLGVPLF